MPEFIAPGVYIEETFFRMQSIEAVPTSTFLIGLTTTGRGCFSERPVQLLIIDTTPASLR